MINQTLTIPCPTCSTPISFDTKQLVMGVGFKCSNCESIIKLTSQSKEIVEDAMSKFEQLKQVPSKKS